MKLRGNRMLGLPPPLFWTVAALLGVAAFIPAIVAWFTAEELVLLYAVRTDPFAIWTGRDGKPGFFRPIIPFVMWLWQKLFGLEPRPYHLLNVILHGINSWLVYVIARRWTDLLPDSHKLKRPCAAAVAALWFWVWPSHSEAVAWIPAITDVAAATFALGSLASYLTYRSGSRWAWALVAVVFYAVALGAKESAITLPAVLMVYELTRMFLTRRWQWRSFLLPGVFALVMGVYFLLRRLLMGAFLGGYGSSVHSNFTWEQLQYSLSPNLANAFLPVPGLTLYQKNWMLPAFMLLCAAGLAWRRKRTGTDAGSAIVVLALALSAVLVFLPGLNLGPGLLMEGQRFAYLASAFAAISVAFTVVYVLPPGRALVITAWAVAIACAGSLALYNNNWYVAGKVARKIVRGMKDLPEGRRVYALNTTDSYREAFIMPHSMEFVYKLMVKEPRVNQLVVASAVSNWSPAVQVKVVPNAHDNVSAPAYTLSLESNAQATIPAPRLDGFIDPLTGQWYTVEQQGDAVSIVLKDFDPATDYVYLLQGSEWVPLQP